MQQRLIRVERPWKGRPHPRRARSRTPWGGNALSNTYHQLARAEHAFFERVSATPLAEIRATGKARIPGLFAA